MINSEVAAKLKTHIQNLTPTFGGRFFYYCLPFRRRVVLKNMRQVFAGVLSTAEIHKLALCFYSHLATSIKENLAMRFMSQTQIQERAVVIGEDHLWKLVGNEIKGAIVLTGHFGNWEFAPIAGILNFKQFKGHFYFVRRTLTNKTIEKILFRRYYQAGLRVIPKKNSLMQVCEKLENHQVVVFVMDQHASVHAKDGIMVEFLGKKAGTFKSVAMIARHTNVPVLPSRSYRRPDGKHVIEFFSPLSWINCDNSEEEIHVNTRQYNKVLENMLLEHPEQWLWVHKRWKDA